MLTVRTLAEHDDPEEALAAYHRIESTAFGDAPDPAHRAAKRPLVEPERWYLAELDGEPCGGVGSFPFRLTLPGGATVPVGGVSDVGVLPTHRRRGVLSTLVDRQLGDMAARGEVAAVLHASEASIYRRFGYGPATRWRQVRVDASRSAFVDGWPDPGGQYRMVPRTEAVADCARVHDRVASLRHGALSRSDAWWQVVLGDVELYIGGGTKRLVILHLDDGGAPDGYVIYDVVEDWSSGQARHRLRVWELIGATPGIELGLWRTVLDHDLVAEVSGPVAVDDVLLDAVRDPRQVRTLWDQDLLWARILDVAAALSARTYGEEGSIVLGVTQQRGDDVAGVYELTADGSASACRRVGADRADSDRVGSDREPDLVLDVSDLGACWLGGSSFRRLARVGRATEVRPGAAELADRMFVTHPAPWCWVRF